MVLNLVKPAINLIKLRRVAVSYRQRLGNERFELAEALVGSHGKKS